MYMPAGQKGRVCMTREDYVKSLIKARGYTFKAFAAEINMPYTTLLSILNGSIGGAAMDNVLRICKSLNISIEELNQVTEMRDGSGEGTSDSTDAALLNLVRELSEEKKIALKILLAKT